MKKAVFCLLFSWLFVICASATYYEITTPSLIEYLTLLSGDSLYMTTGSIGDLRMYEESTAIIEGTSLSPFDCDIPYPGDGGIICMPGSYGIYHIQMAGTSALAIYGGNIKELDMNNSATVVLELDSNKTILVEQIDITGNSSLSMSSGRVDRIEVGGIQGGVIVIDPNGTIAPPPIDPEASPSVILSGGRIDEICSHRSSEAVSIEPSITLECSYYYYDESTQILTGCWLDGTEFNIELIESQMSHNPTINDIQFIGAEVKDIYINGSTHVFDDATFENDRVFLGIEGPSEPPVPYAANYSIGSPVHAELVDDGRVGWLSAYNFSSINMTGGEVVHELTADNSHLEISGGTIGEGLVSQNEAIVFMTGGTMGEALEVIQCGRITLYGTDFEVTDLDGVTMVLSPGDKLSDFGTLVSESGQTPYYAGTITGTLSYGTVLNNPFKIEVCQDCYFLFGDIHISRFMGFRATVVALSKDDTGLLLKNNSELTVVTGNDPIVAECIIANSLSEGGMQVQGRADIYADILNVAGGMAVKGSLSYPEEMDISDNLGEDSVVPDFLEGIEEPDYIGLPDLCPVDPDSGRTLPIVISRGEATLEPGYYSAGIIIDNATVSCQPGIYHLGDGQKGNSGLILKENAVVDANEVMFHIVEEGQVLIGNNAILTASAPTDGDYKGFQFFQSRNNTTQAIFKGITDCAGRWYFPVNHIEVAGDARCSMLIADTIALSSNAKLIVDPNR